MKKTVPTITDSSLRCRDNQERRLNIRTQRSNGLDYIEICEDQRQLKLFFIDQAPYEISASNVRIDGGARIRGIKPVKVERRDRGDDDLDDFLLLTVNRAGDFSNYTLRLVEADTKGRPTETPLRGFDPRYAQLDFSFKTGCPSDFDCLPEAHCAPVKRTDPEINYLAKDYAGFRQLIFDRLALLMPEWKERHIPDLGVTLVELLAYTGDYLSYYQDAVATEAYLDTARQRISVRRHARLVDYTLHEGCNARTWIAIETNEPHYELDPSQIYFITGHNEVLRNLPSVSNEDDLRSNYASNTTLPELYEVFEPVITRPVQSSQMRITGCGKAYATPLRHTQPATPAKIHIYQSHSAISFYTWDERECCLARGATRATLDDGEKPAPPEAPEPGEPCDPQQQSPDDQKYAQQPIEQKPPETERKLHLQAGDVLIFEEVIGPKTGNSADADPKRRHAVRLTSVEQSFDPLHHYPIVEIEWAEADALPFDLCLSVIGPAPGCKLMTNVSVARGNVILADHGYRVSEPPWTVAPEQEIGPECRGIGRPGDPILRAKPFRPRLKFWPLVFSSPFPSPDAVAQQQALALNGIRERVIERINELWLAGRQLSDNEIAELRTIFGKQAMIEALELKPPPKSHEKAWRKLTAEKQAQAIGRLMAAEERWFGKKFDRAATLQMRAQSGYIGGAELPDEIAELFGERFIDGLETNSPQTLGPASLALEQDPRSALPAINLLESGSLSWASRPDLLGSYSTDRHFVVEIDDRGLAHLRFGDGELGRAPEPGAELQPIYRIGGGARGNVGREAISHLIFRGLRVSGLSITRVRNPLAAKGGTDPEPKAEAKLFAPQAFRRIPQRAVTAEDYARLAMQHPKVQRAAAELRWNGGNFVVRVAIDQLGAEQADPALLAEIVGRLHIFRRIGHDIVVEPAQYVSLEIVLEICALPNYLNGHIKAALRDVFGAHTLPDGRRGLFHPDNLTFGDGIYLSQLVAAAQSVAGVESARVAKLERMFQGPNGELENGVLPLGGLEIARLDNDPSFPEHGKLTLIVRGGR